MDKPTIPLDEMTKTGFAKFKARHLDHKSFVKFKPLTEEVLEEISKLVKTGDDTVGRVCCDEYHGHVYDCVDYFNPTTGVVDRLVSEIRHYQELFKKITAIVPEELS